jgi:hypothetical protein
MATPGNSWGGSSGLRNGPGFPGHNEGATRSTGLLPGPGAGARPEPAGETRTPSPRLGLRIGIHHPDRTVQNTSNKAQNKR